MNTQQPELSSSYSSPKEIGILNLNSVSLENQTRGKRRNQTMSELARDAAEDDRVSSMPEVDKAAGRVSTQSPKEV
jgi:hypothetical protein